MSIILAGRYRLEERIALGGMGEVWRAHDERLNRTVAVKLLKPELAEQPSFLERFRREAQSAAALSHPNVASVYDYGAVEGRPYIVMEFVAGETLAQRIARMGRIPWPQALDIGVEVAHALAAAHARSLVHRDIKPGNVLLDATGHAKVTDFGIALADQATALTQTGSVVGTASYMAPEQASALPVGPAADIYALGAVLYHAITGHPPYEADHSVAVAMQHISAPVPDIRADNPALPDNVALLLMQAMDKKPGRRFTSAAAFAAAIEHVRASASVAGSATPPIVVDSAVLAADTRRLQALRRAVDPTAVAPPTQALGPATAGMPVPPPLPTPSPGSARGAATTRRMPKGARRAQRRGGVGIILAALAVIALLVVGLNALRGSPTRTASVGTPAPTPTPTTAAVSSTKRHRHHHAAGSTTRAPSGSTSSSSTGSTSSSSSSTTSGSTTTSPPTTTTPPATTASGGPTVPSGLVGLPESQATQALDAANLPWHIINTNGASPGSQDQVLSTQPAGGQPVSSSGVTVFVGPPSTTTAAPAAASTPVPPPTQGGPAQAPRSHNKHQPHHRGQHG